MQPSAKFKLLWAPAGVLGVAAVVLTVLGFVLIMRGAYPPEGTGSLGHVGMVIAGIIAGFLALILGLFMVLCISKAERLRAQCVLARIGIHLRNALPNSRPNKRSGSGSPYRLFTKTLATQTQTLILNFAHFIVP